MITHSGARYAGPVWLALGLVVFVAVFANSDSPAAAPGMIMQQLAALAIDDTETAELFTPFLREHGVKCLLGVPLLIEGRVLGVIHVGRFTQRPFSEDDTRLLQLVAFRVALKDGTPVVAITLENSPVSRCVHSGAPLTRRRS